MKKIYTKPSFLLVNIAAEGMIAISLAYDPDPNKGGTQMLSNKKSGLGSDIWGDMEETSEHKIWGDMKEN